MSIRLPVRRRCTSLYPESGVCCVLQVGHHGLHKNRLRTWAEATTTCPDLRTVCGLTYEEWEAEMVKHEAELRDATERGDAEGIESGMNDVSVCSYVLGLPIWKETT